MRLEILNLTNDVYNNDVYNIYITLFINNF